MIENRLILLLRKGKSLTPKFATSNSSKWKLISSPSIETLSKSYFSFSRFIPSAKAPITRSFAGYGLRSLLQNKFTNFHVPSFRNFSTGKPVNANAEGLKPLVTAGTSAQDAIGIWLFVSAAWVYSMVVLGGISRLARFGLSMTDRKFTGRLPLSDDDWLVEFEKYKQSHEYKRMNKHMDLIDFQFMYWMEYARLLWGRSLGVCPSLVGKVSKDVFVLKMQFVHQILTAASLFSVAGLWLSMKKLDIPPALRSLIGSTIGIAAVQVISGTAPLFSTAPASLGTLNQAGALTLLTLAIYLIHIARRPSLQLLKTISSK